MGHHRSDSASIDATASKRAKDAMVMCTAVHVRGEAEGAFLSVVEVRQSLAHHEESI